MKKLNNLLESIAKPLIPITPWLLRLGLGTSFILHGIGKFPLPPEKMVTWFESMGCLLYTSPSPRDRQKTRMPSSA